MTNVDIIGTCFSRELFNETDKYNVNNYLMQQSIFTMNAKALPITMDEVRTHDDFNFKRRMVYYEFNKLALSKLRENPSLYLVIDLFNELKNILVFQNPSNVRLISSQDIRLSLQYLEEKYGRFEYDTVDVTSLPLTFLREVIERFVTTIKEIYDENKIVINVGQIPTYYYVEGQKIYFLNDLYVDREWFIHKLESILIGLLPGAIILRTNRLPIADINHRFGGPHSVHFENIYYRYRMNVFDALINGQSVQDIDKQYDSDLACEIDKIKMKKLVL